MRFFSIVAACVAVLSSSGCASASSDSTSPEDVDSSESDLVTCPAEGTRLVLKARSMRADIEAARLAFDAAESNGGSWKSVGDIALFTYSRCVSPQPTIADLENALPSDLQQDIGGLRGADVLARAGIESDRFLSGPNGAPLLAAIDQWAGRSKKAKATSEGLEHWDEIPCQNCTDHATVTVLHYPRTHKVVVLRGRYGWDS